MPLETHLQKETIPFKADLFSLGVVAAQVLIGKNQIFGSKSFWYFDKLDQMKKQTNNILPMVFQMIQLYGSQLVIDFLKTIGFELQLSFAIEPQFDRLKFFNKNLSDQIFQMLFHLLHPYP
jgi:hypothetical protein